MNAKAKEEISSHLQVEFEARVWLYDGPAAWHFLTVPQEFSGPIKALSRGTQKAFGSVKVTATIGQTSWKTSLFPDSKLGSYLLPLKLAVRKKEKIQLGDTVKLLLKIDD